MLTIDVASELRKLSQAQVQGPWQVPAELVRRALRAGARHVEVTFGRHWVLVVDDGPGLDPAQLQWVATLIDVGRHNEERHRALAALESAGELALLSLAGVDHLRELTIDTVGRTSRCTLKLEATSPVLAVERLTVPAAREGTRIHFRSPGLERERAARWLAGAARFSPVPVVLGGVPVVDGFRGSPAQVRLRPPLRGRVALTAEGEAAHVYLLAFGIVVAHLSIPDSPGFEAALELGAGDVVPSPAGLREAALALVPELVQQAVSLLLSTAAQTAAVDESRRGPLARLALQAARRGRRMPEVERAPVFRTIAAGGPALIDLETLRRYVGGDPAASPGLLALAPTEVPARYALGDGPVLIADDAERSLLAEVLGTRFRTPSRRESAPSLGGSVRRGLHCALGAIDRWIDLVRHPIRRPVLADEALTAAERALLAAFRDELRARPGELRGVVMCAGSGPLRRAHHGQPTVVLPRQNPTVMAAVRAFAADPAWIRIIHLALLSQATPTRRPKTPAPTNAWQ